MLLQTNSYIVPQDRRADHARLVRRFRQALLRIGCDQFEVYEQVGANWSPAGSSGRFVQIMRFRDRQHQQAVQVAERNDPGAQQIIAQFCDLINFPYQQEHGYFSTSFYVGLLPAPSRQALDFEEGPTEAPQPFGQEFAGTVAQADEEFAAEESPIEFGESQEAIAPESRTQSESETASEQDGGPVAEEAAAEEVVPASASPQEAAIAPTLEEAEAEALALVAKSPADAARVEVHLETGVQETPDEAEIPAQESDEYEFDLGVSPAAEPVEPALEQSVEPASAEQVELALEQSGSEPAALGEAAGNVEATEPALDEIPEDASAALISFLDSLTREDLAADDSVANHVDADGHVREVDPVAIAEPQFADDAIASEGLEPEAAELVTADEFAPAESTGSDSGGDEPISEDHAEGEGEENSLEFESFLREIQGPSADPAHR